MCRMLLGIAPQTFWLLGTVAVWVAFHGLPPPVVWAVGRIPGLRPLRHGGWDFLEYGLAAILWGRA
ncbi:MAG: hypothetical protein QW247_07655 [Pyrobaculum sp.]